MSIIGYHHAALAYLYRLTHNFIVVVRSALFAYVVIHLHGFFVTHKCRLNTLRCGHLRRLVKHITTTEQLLCAHLVYDGTAIYLAHRSECNARWHVRLNESGNDVYTRALGCKYEVYTGRTSLLCYSHDECLNITCCHHHKVAQLVYNYDDIRHFFFRFNEVVFLYVSLAHFGHGTQPPFHFCDRPLQGRNTLFWLMNHGREEMR